MHLNYGLVIVWHSIKLNLGSLRYTSTVSSGDWNTVYSHPLVWSNVPGAESPLTLFVESRKLAETRVWRLRPPVTRNVRNSHLYRCRHAGMGHIHPGQASCLGGRASCHLPGGKAWCQGFPEEMAWCHMVSEVQNTRSSKRVALHKTGHSTEVAPLIDLGKVHTGN